MDNTTDALVNFASGLNYTDLTPGAIHAAKRSFIDSVGCAMGGFHAAPLQAVRRLAAQTTATRPATVIGTGIRTSPELAALANGAMIRYLDFSDDYFGGGGDIGPHPSDSIGGVLAAAESADGDGKALIMGMVIAYEVCGQITDHVVVRGGKRTWDYPVFHAIATSLGAGKVWGLSRAQMRDALALAVIPNISLAQTRFGQISNWKGFRGPNGSRNGVFAAQMAREGITGPDDPFEGKAGFMNHLEQPFHLGALGGNGTPFKIESTFFKCLPVRYDVQLPVWVALELRGKVRLDDIEAICVFREKRSVVAGANNPEYWNPTTRETADHSLPYLIGAALLDGAITEVTYTPERFRDPAILALMQKIRMEEDKTFTAAYPRTFHCRLEITLRSGQVIAVSQTNPKGHPANPMSDREIEDKFLTQARAAALPDRRARDLLQRMWSLDAEKRVGELIALMRLPAEGGRANSGGRPHPGAPCSSATSRP